MEETPQEIQYSHIYLSETAQNKSDTKIVELKNLKSNGVYTEIEDNNQSCFFQHDGSIKEVSRRKANN